MYKKIYNFLIVLLAVFASTCASVSKGDFAGLGKANDIVPLTSRAITGKLPNGLQYYIMENSRPENRAHLALAVNAGSVLERDDERGFAHFVEHLAFNDTARFPKLELIEYLRSLGMRFGADANAYTSYDETVYHFDVPVEVQNGIKIIPDKALAILDDWTHAISFKPEDVQSESRVVLEEHRSRKDAMERVRNITLPVLFGGSAYADRSPIGLPEIIESATAEQLRSFYDRWYTSDNMALVFVGDFNGKALEESLTRHFTKPAAEKPVNRPRHELPPPKKGNFHVQIITDPELTSTDFLIYYKMKPGAQRGTLAYYRDSVVNYLIDIMFNLRFDEAMTKPEASATQAWSGIWQWSVNSRFFSMGTNAKNSLSQAALTELLLEKEAALRFGFTEDELYRAKLHLVSYLEKQLSEKDQQNSRSFIRGFTSHFTKGEDMADIEWEMDAVNRLLPGIGVKEISAAVKSYFADNDCTVFLIAPLSEAENLPSAERIKAIFSETAKAKISAREKASLSGELLDTSPQPGKIVSESADRETGALVITLSNGAKVILKETANKNNEIMLYAMAKGGTFNAPEEDIVSVRLASEMVGASGLGQFTRTELVNLLAGKQVSLSFWDDNYYRGFQGSSTLKDIKTLFEMIYLFFTKQEFDDGAVSALLDQYRTALAHQYDDPQRVFSMEIENTTYNNHPRFKPLELSDIDKVSKERSFNYIKNCVNPGDYTFVFTGNINIDEMRRLSENYIASIPPSAASSAAMNQWIDPKIVRPGRTEIIVRKGIDDKCMVYLGWFAPGAAAFSEERNIASSVLSGYLKILLTDEIREKMGGVYSIYAGSAVSVIPTGEYRMVVSFECSPDRAEEIVAEVQRLLSNAAREPVNMDTFNKSKEALLKEYENSIQRNLYIAQSYANSSVLYNTPLGRINTRPQIIRAVTQADMQTFCREVIARGPVQVILYPEK